MHNKSIDELLVEFKSSLNGLTLNDVLTRQKEKGLNVLPKKKKKTIFSVFLEQFKDPFVILLLLASLVSLFIGEVVDSFFILICILSDAIIGTIQEWKAKCDSEKLENFLKDKQTVIRDGKQIIIDSEQLVVGDIILLESGNKIGADARIIEVNNLTVNESSLTGESINVSKCEGVLPLDTPFNERSNYCYAGTTVITGRAKAIVTNIGINTEIGKIAKHVLVNEDTKTPLTIRLEKFTKQITSILIFISLIISVILYFKGYDLNNIFFLVIALFISAIPEGLPMVLTVALSVATKQMAKKNVIVKKLNAVEALGSCTVIASDKTGTLTVNEQTAKMVVLNNGAKFEIGGTGYNDIGDIKGPNNLKDLEKLKTLAMLGAINNEAYLKKVDGKFESSGDAIDLAFLALNYKVNKNENIKVEVSKLIPYESSNAYSMAYYNYKEHDFVTIKGSMEAIEKNFNLKNEQMVQQHNELAKQGYRVIAIANGEVIDDKIEKLTFLGLVGFIDPIKEGVRESIIKCREAGIKVIMITGDHPLTALKIAKDLDFENLNIATGKDLEEYAKKEQKEFDDFVKQTSIFSCVTPIQKLEIVESFKRQGEFIAVTGDGVNDAPALKSANIGIAMGNGSDVAKDTADLVIVDNNFTSIVNGVEEGRIAYGNIRKTILFLLSCGVCEIISYLLAIIFNLEIPFLAIQLLWINLVTDGIQDIALACEKKENLEMKRKPINPKSSIFDKELVTEIILSGLISATIIFIFWVYLNNYLHMDINLARAYTLFLMVIIQNLHVFNCRSEKKSIFTIPLNNNYFLIISIFLTILLQVFVSLNSTLSKILSIDAISLDKLILLFIPALLIIVVMEIYKLIKKISKKNVFN